MFKATLSLLALFFAAQLHAQIFQWAKPINSTATRGMAVVTDDDGNVYVCGNVAGMADFDPGSGTAISEVHAGTTNIFLMKYDADGQYQWHVALSNTGGAIAKGLALDGNGDLVMAGRYEASITFGPGAAGTITSHGGMDCFIAKFTTSGQFVWVRGFGGTMGDEIHGLAIDAGNNIIVSGFFSSTVDFDPGPGVTQLQSQGGFDGFVAKYGPTGAFQWVRGVQGTGSARMWSVTTDNTGHIHALGHFTGQANVAGAFPIESAGLTDGLLCRFGPAGGAIWARTFGGATNVTTERLLNDGAGQLFITGSFTGAVDIDPGAGTLEVTSVGNNNVYFAKLDTAGNAIWGHGIRAVNHFDGVGDIALDDEGNLYLCGAHNVELDLDPGPGLAIHPAPTGTGHDLFLAKYDAAGSFMWSRAIITEGGFDTANDITVDPDGHVIVTGSYGLSAEFDAVDPAGSLAHTSTQSGFTSKYSPDLGTGTLSPFVAGSEWVLYPNPADSELRVLLVEGEKQQAFEVIDAAGRVLQQRVGPMTGPLDVSALRPGHYHLRLLVEGTWQVRAFVVLR